MGFTLVEVLLATVIAGLISVVLVHTLLNAFNLSAEVHRDDRAGRDAQFVVASLNRDLGQANRLLALTPNSLSLVTVEGDTVSYAWSGTVSDSLTKQVNSSAPRVIADEVEKLLFSVQTITRPYRREQDMPDTLEYIVTHFDEGDWDDDLAAGGCHYESRGRFRVHENDICGEQFWNVQESFIDFSRVRLRVASLDMATPQTSLVVNIYDSDGVGGYPGTPLAQGFVAPGNIGTSFDWVEATMATITEAVINPAGHYWLVIKDNAGWSSSYAGHVEYERIDCAWSTPMNGMCYDYSYDGGGHWSGGSGETEMFHYIYGRRIEMRLTEVSQSRVDTLGVAYTLTLSEGEEREDRAGFIPIQNL